MAAIVRLQFLVVARPPCTRRRMFLTFRNPLLARLASRATICMHVTFECTNTAQRLVDTILPS